MSTPFWSALAAFVFGILVMVLLVSSGMLNTTGGQFWHRGLFSFGSSSDAHATPVMITVGSADTTPDAQCPPVFHVSNETNRNVYFQIDTPDEAEDNSRSNSYPQGYSRDGNNQRPYPPSSAAPGPAQDDETQPVLLQPGEKIKADQFNGYGRRHHCPGSDVNVRVTD